MRLQSVPESLLVIHSAANLDHLVLSLLLNDAVLEFCPRS